MSVTVTKPRKRLTREESREQTRATLIAVGRAHFLRYGLGGAVAEKIAEDAGYSRGALYSNFDSKEELFLAVMHEEEARRVGIFRSILNEELSSKARLKKMRDAFADLVTLVADRDWIVLHAEFEAEALRSERIRKNFVELHRQTIRDGAKFLRELLKTSGIILSMRPNEFITATLSFSHGLAVTQKIFGAELSQKRTRTLILTFFDRMVSAACPPYSLRHRRGSFTA